MNLSDSLRIFLRGPAMAQVFVAVFLLYLVWAVSHHLWIAFWFALIVALLFQFWLTRGNASDSTASAPIDASHDATAAWMEEGMRRLPDLLLRYANSMFPVTLKT